MLRWLLVCEEHDVKKGGGVCGFVLLRTRIRRLANQEERSHVLPSHKSILQAEWHHQ